MTHHPASSDQSVPFRILLVEDNEGDEVLTRRALAAAGIYHELTVIDDGELARDHLARISTRKERPPALILLDLNLPKVQGLDLLAFIKDDGLLRRIPAVVLTSSSAESDIIAALDRHANAYVVKPLQPDMFNSMVKSMSSFWLEYALQR